MCLLSKGTTPCSQLVRCRLIKRNQSNTSVHKVSSKSGDSFRLVFEICAPSPRSSFS